VFEIFPRLEEREAQLAGTMSGGEQAMLSIGRGMMGDPLRWPQVDFLKSGAFAVKLHLHVARGASSVVSERPQPYCDGGAKLTNNKGAKS
jgi:hypothetical protein